MEQQRASPDAGTITIEASLASHNPRGILLRGKFSVACGKNGVPEEPKRALKHLVMVVTRSGNYQALTPFREVVVFDDDVKVHDNLCSASFHISVMDHIGFDGPGDYYILCSLGEHLSNIEKVTLT
jgi:hypothetical protein